LSLVSLSLSVVIVCGQCYYHCSCVFCCCQSACHFFINGCFLLSLAVFVVVSGGGGSGGSGGSGGTNPTPDGGRPEENP